MKAYQKITTQAVADSVAVQTTVITAIKEDTDNDVRAAAISALTKVFSASTIGAAKGLKPPHPVIGVCKGQPWTGPEGPLGPKCEIGFLKNEKGPPRRAMRKAIWSSSSPQPQ